MCYGRNEYTNYYKLFRWFLISMFAMHRFDAKTPVAPQQSASGDDSNCEDLVHLLHFI